MRHEEARPTDEQGDRARALTPQGRHRGHRQARALFDAVTGLDRIWTSPLVRAVQTAEILVSHFDLDTPVLAHEGVVHPLDFDSLLALVTSGNHPVGTVGLVGHEPTLSAFTSGLLRGAYATSYRTGQAYLLTPNIDGFELEATFHGGQSLALPARRG